MNTVFLHLMHWVAHTIRIGVNRKEEARLLSGDKGKTEGYSIKD